MARRPQGTGSEHRNCDGCSQAPAEVARQHWDKGPSGRERKGRYGIALESDGKVGEGGTLRIQRAAAFCGCSAALALAALAPATVLADNPGNPGHHYGQLSNPGHHYGQLKHNSTLPSPPPIVVPSAPPAPVPIPGTGPSQTIRTPVDAPGRPTSGSIGTVTGPQPVAITVVVPAPVPGQVNWLTVIVVAALFAAGIVAVVILVGRGGSYLISLARPSVRGYQQVGQQARSTMS